MPFPATLLLLATLLPLISAGLLLFYGRKLGDPIAGIGASVFIGLSLCCSLSATTSWLSQVGLGTWGPKNSPIVLTAPWIPIGVSSDVQGVRQDHPGWLDVGVFIDSLTIAMFNMITLVATLVHVFAIAYMKRDRDYPRFFAYLSLFCFAMLALVISATLIQILVFWELVGLCSYLLIGFWIKRPSASAAALKAFIVNRVGDTGFLIGLGLLMLIVGNATIPSLWALLSSAGLGNGVTLPDGSQVSNAMLTMIGVCLFTGAIAKSAQYPLHVWLPDAMEGPSPVSALIHAATMVAAGVYLVGRIFPILTPEAKLFIAVIGVITLTLGAIFAMVQRDIKRVLAYSTMSQLGYMMLAMGVGSWVGGLFHLITHAFFKSLLFLGAGSVIHAMHHEQKLSQFGGLYKRLPVTAIAFGIGVLAIAGTPFLSGFYSKEMILTDTAAFVELASARGYGWSVQLLFILPVIVAYMTAFYMTRCWMLTFWGKPRNPELSRDAYENPTMWVPLIGLAAMSIIAGTLPGVSELLEGSMTEASVVINQSDELHAGVYVKRDASHIVDPFETAWSTKVPVAPESDDMGMEREPAPALSAGQVALLHGQQRAESATFWAFLVGIGAAIALYARGPGLAMRFGALPGMGATRDWIESGFYLDDLYAHVFVAVTVTASRAVAGVDRWIVDPIVAGVSGTVRLASQAIELWDRFVIDGAVQGVSNFWQATGGLLRLPQTGRIRAYVTFMLAAVTIGAATLVWVAIR